MANPEKPEGYPSGMMKAGKDAWDRAWETTTVRRSDYDSIMMMCRLTDERAAIERERKKKPMLISINNDTNVVLNPLTRRLEAIDKQLESLYDKLGMTPLGRAKIGEAAAENASENPYEKLANEWKTKPAPKRQVDA